MDLNAVHGQNGRFQKKHGMNGHPFYAVWNAMMGRCYQASHKHHVHYGGRGIYVCDEWQNPCVFLQWLDDNNYGKGLQIDRIDNDGPYSPENCRLVTAKENCRNRRNNRRYKVRGELLTAPEVEEKYGVRAATFRARVERYGKTPDEALKSSRKPHKMRHSIDGVSMTPGAISEKFGISRSTFLSRVNRGWDAKRAATVPVRRIASSL